MPLESRTVHFHDTAAREAADAECEVERDRTGGDDVDRHAFGEIAHIHYRAFAELALDLRECIIEGGGLLV